MIKLEMCPACGQDVRVEVEELMPCPFCGHEARVDGDNVKGHHITCIECLGEFRARHGIHWTREYAVWAWNQRVVEKCPDANQC